MKKAKGKWLKAKGKKENNDKKKMGE